MHEHIQNGLMSSWGIPFSHDDKMHVATPISVATAMSKVFERLIAKQIDSFVTTKISNLLCAYRKGHRAQHALIRLTETIRKTLDRKGVAGMIFMDLSKAFNCMPHDLLILS